MILLICRKIADQVLNALVDDRGDLRHLSCNLILVQRGFLLSADCRLPVGVTRHSLRSYLNEDLYRSPDQAAHRLDLAQGVESALEQPEGLEEGVDSVEELVELGVILGVGPDRLEKVTGVRVGGA